MPSQVLCVTKAAIPPGYALPPSCLETSCVACGATLIMGRSTATHVAAGEMVPVCVRCMKPPESVGMTPEQLDEYRDIIAAERLN